MDLDARAVLVVRDDVDTAADELHPQGVDLLDLDDLRACDDPGLGCHVTLLFAIYLVPTDTLYRVARQGK